MNKLIDIIIPCYNEQDNVEMIYQELSNFTLEYQDYDFNYIFCDDGSKDLTKLKVKELAKEDTNVKLVSFSRNFGKEAAILAGLDYSTGDAVIIIDADLQMPVSYIAEFIEKWENGYKLVLTCKSTRRKGIKSWLAHNYYKIHNKLTNTDVEIDALDFQLMNRQVVDIICEFRERKRFFKGITGYIGFDYDLITVDIENRVAGDSSFSSYSSLFKYAFDSFLPYSSFPLLISIYFGFIIAVGAAISLIIIILKTIIYGGAPDGYPTLIVTMLFFFGCTLLMIGVLVYYIGLIYEEVKRRPNYIVDESINFEEQNEK